MPITLQVRSIEQGLSVVAIQGDARHSDAKPGTNPFRDALGEQWPTMKVVLDLMHTDTVDSAAAGWLMASATQFSQRGGALVVCCASDFVKQVFKFIKLEKKVPVVEDEAAARQALAPK